MCGIIGYIGENVKDVLLNGLEFLEYRGYDSAGIAVQSREANRVEIYKQAGRVSHLRDNIKVGLEDAYCGIGHTRWATHGGVCDVNAHPHSFNRVTLVHNGIIENYRELAQEYDLVNRLKSETDSEVVAGLLDELYVDDPYETIRCAIRKLKGTYALVIMFSDRPGEIYSVRNVSPIVSCVCEQGTFLASDPAFLCRYANRYLVLPEYHILKLSKGSLSITAPDGSDFVPEYQVVNWAVSVASKENYPFFMEKEIMEQPTVLQRTLQCNTENGFLNLDTTHISDEFYRKCEHICIVACGTAMHAGMVGQALMKKHLHLNVQVEMASEFIYGDTYLDENTLFIAVSQSGETIDTLEALKMAKQKGAKCLAILNVRGSAISRECDACIFTEAGPEIAVASTKAYTTQLLVFYLLMLKLSLLKGCMSEEEVRTYISELNEVPKAVAMLLENKNAIHLAAKNVLEASDLFMVGRGLDYIALMEGSLKLKEVSYIHSEAYASGELKHGPIALITEGTPVVATVTQKALLEKSLSNLKEMRSRGAAVVVMVKEAYAAKMPADYHVIHIPELPDEIAIFPVAVALQLFAYYVSSDKGFDVDKPRNLAKVVTVE